MYFCDVCTNILCDEASLAHYTTKRNPDNERNYLYKFWSIVHIPIVEEDIWNSVNWVCDSV